MKQFIYKLKKVIKKLETDYMSLNWDNDNETKVIESNYFSAYKKKRTSISDVLFSSISQSC